VRGLVNYRKNGSAFKHDLLLTPLRRASDGVALYVVGEFSRCRRCSTVTRSGEGAQS